MEACKTARGSSPNVPVRRPPSPPTSFPCWHLHASLQRPRVALHSSPESGKPLPCFQPVRNENGASLGRQRGFPLQKRSVSTPPTWRKGTKERSSWGTWGHSAHAGRPPPERGRGPRNPLLRRAPIGRPRGTGVAVMLIRGVSLAGPPAAAPPTGRARPRRPGPPPGTPRRLRAAVRGARPPGPAARRGPPKRRSRLRAGRCLTVTQLRAHPFLLFLGTARFFLFFGRSNFCIPASPESWGPEAAPSLGAVPWQRRFSPEPDFCSWAGFASSPSHPRERGAGPFQPRLPARSRPPPPPRPPPLLRPSRPAAFPQPSPSTPQYFLSLALLSSIRGFTFPTL